MKNTLKEKFKNNALVKPLYKRLKNDNKINPTVISVDNIKLDGHGIKLKSEYISHSGEVTNLKHTHNTRKKIFVCDACEVLNKSKIFVKKTKFRKVNSLKYILKGIKMINTAANGEVARDVNLEDKTNKLIQAGDNKDSLQHVPCTWLRVYPLPQIPGETIGSVIFRCTFCQFGLATFLVIWTTIWIFVIYYFEGPAEIKMYHSFAKQQNQVVIDLATELRQISPLSNRWKAAIEKRVEEACQVTSVAVLNGARLRPGQYWSLSGTFLFTIYVMTALGFGAPVPRTIEGRTAVLVYAALAIPTHFFLMMNASMCIVVHAQAYVKQLNTRICDKKPFGVVKTALDNVSESPNCSRHSEVLKATSRCCLGEKIMRCFGILSACHSLPLAAVLYYLAGACIFGMLHEVEPLKTLMFPIEFTTSGGLDHIPGHFRILYGFYIEGAMILISCTVVTLRRYSTPSFHKISQNYRLFIIKD